MALVKRKGGRGPYWSTGYWDTGNGDSGVHGVDLHFVCGCVPVLTLDTASVFHEHVSMMLQSALSSTGKADALYDYNEDEDILVECRRYGYRDDDLMLAHLKRHDLRKVRAVGTTGKRSVMLALVVGLSLKKGDTLHELWELLRSYGLYAAFAEVLNLGKEAMAKTSYSASKKAHTGKTTKSSPSPWTSESDPVASILSDTSSGVELSMVCKNVPVIGLDKQSVFQESASWLLQTAMSSESKADALYDFYLDKEILAECCQLGLSKDEVAIARLRRADVRNIKAAGTTGKRSVMLALVVALVLHDKVQVERLMKDMCEYDSALEQPFLALVRSAMDHDPCGVHATRRLQLTKKDSPTPEELRARGERLQRFKAAAQAAARGAPDGEVQKAASTDEKPLEGSCTDLERPYFRITALPCASDVRPVPVLRQAFALVCERWAEEHDWVYASEMLRSIRQDLTVQMVRGDFAVEVYEFCARVALELGDFKQFDQCSMQLEDLYSEAEASTAPHMPEFLAYRLLYLTMHGERLALSAFLNRHAWPLHAAITDGEPHLVHAWALRGALEKGSLPELRRLVERACPIAATEAMCQLSSKLLEGLRLQQLAAICKAFRYHVSRGLLLRLFAGDDAAGEDEAALEGLPLFFKEGDTEAINVDATAAEAERLLSMGVRKRLGEQSTDHMKGFVRATSTA
mmetsp:Transcript_111815/g.311149  ORF Transcript_111815/g.311149 Transcript_111815/m.311149 type:complete len:689 (-) Transcript_111815:340-2406(-)|eukprot:CAMPEP_0179094566 /NCGR_PEP_ID=MMETSP0796-20121207/43377_1 /TAXON_ID=73915 /ORGANISM="Pyrodinium bahamense, Strain pbaha01" /LENGTH=688 /DNA_ID=CAMNT_0020792243 /DNA_START=29 /DNA_END=2095 /DNA_ORIENTATION=-